MRNLQVVLIPRRSRAIRESQRDSVSKPRVARDELPWVAVSQRSPTAKRLRPIPFHHRVWRSPQPRWGGHPFLTGTQDSSFLATLGWRSQSPFGLFALEHDLIRHAVRTLSCCLRFSTRFRHAKPQLPPGATLDHRPANPHPAASRRNAQSTWSKDDHWCGHRNRGRSRHRCATPRERRRA